jgi:hypothetical protein
MSGTAANATTEELAELLLERLILEYATCELEMRETLDVSNLFKPGLEDTGYGRLAWAIDGFSRNHVREVATKVFREASTATQNAESQ